MDVSATGTYPQCEQYRRALIMVDCGNDQSYFIDIFNVAGGKQHDYSLHGPPGAFEAIGGRWSEQSRGTLAGEEVELDQIYDDPKLGAPGYKDGFGDYAGSGFQHLCNVRRLSSGETIAQWSHEKDPSAKLRIRVLEQPGQQLILANAHVSAMKFPQVLTYVIARRQGENLASKFVSVIEPYKDQPLIESVRNVSSENATAIEVLRTDGGTDSITYDARHVEVVRRDANGTEIGRFEVGGSAGRSGTVVAVDPAHTEVRVRPEQPDVQPEDFVGRVVQFRNELHRTSHTVVAAKRDGQDIVLHTADDLLVGRARVDGSSDDALTTKTAMPLSAIYRGVTLGNASFEPLARVADVHDGKIKLAKPIDDTKRPAAGDDIWLINIGPGDRFELPAVIDKSQ
jgi:hypothetical protein